MKGAFNNYCRSEKYFSATLLSFLLLHNNFEGLKKFLSFLNRKQIYPHYHDIAKPIRKELITSDSETHYATEMNVVQDFSHGGYNINVQAFDRKKNKEAVPDIIAVLGNVILILEVKYYSSFNEKSIETQLEQQKYIFDVLRDYYDNQDLGELHVCLCPDRNNISNGYIVTWQDIYDLFKDTPNCSFVLECLKNNLDSYSRIFN